MNSNQRHKQKTKTKKRYYIKSEETCILFESKIKLKFISKLCFYRKEDLKNIEDRLKQENAEFGTNKNKNSVKNTYKWLLRKEEAKARAKGPEPEQLKAQAIVNY